MDGTIQRDGQPSGDAPCACSVWGDPSMTPIRRILSGLVPAFACPGTGGGSGPNRAGRHDAHDGRHGRSLPDRSRQGHGQLHRRHAGRDAAPAASQCRRGTADHPRRLGAAVRRRGHADLGLRARLQLQPRAGADRRRQRQRSVERQRRGRLRQLPHREPRPHRSRARPDEHDVRQPGDGRRHQHGDQGRQGADERRGLHRTRHAADEQQRRLRAR